MIFQFAMFRACGRKVAGGFITICVMALGMVLSGCGFGGDGVSIPPVTPPASSSLEFSPINNGLTTIDALDVKTITMVNPLFAGTKGGVFKSNDGGGSWTGASAGILPDAQGKQDIKVIVADPKNSQVLYAGANNGVFKSSDQGATWTSKSIGILPDSKGTTEIKEGSFVVHPADSNILYAGTKNGLFKSIDGGENWTLVQRDLFPTNPDGDHEVKSLLLDPANPSILYAGTRDGLFKSPDGGGHGPGQTQELRPIWRGVKRSNRSRSIRPLRRASTPEPAQGCSRARTTGRPGAAPRRGSRRMIN